MAVRTCQVASRPDRPDARSGQVWLGPAETCQMAVRTAESASQGAIYRPLSIATSVENDWARGGPFWRSALTLALETVRFLKKSANHKIAQNCRKRYIFFLYPRKSRKIDDFFASAARSMPPFATRRSHGIQTKISTFLRGQKVPKFCDFLGPGQTCQTCQNRCPDSSWQVPGRSVGPAGIAVRTAPGRSCRVLAKSARNRLFCDFCDFCDFCEILRFLRFLQFFEIFAIFAISADFRKPDKKYDL